MKSTKTSIWSATPLGCVSKNLFRTLLVGSALVLAARADSPAQASLEDRVQKLETQLNDVVQQNQALRQKMGEVASSSPAAKNKYPKSDSIS
jgi:hypothetical protein